MGKIIKDIFTNNFFALKLPSQTLILWTLFSKNDVFYVKRKTARLRGVQIWLKCIFDMIFSMGQKYMDGVILS